MNLNLQATFGNIDIYLFDQLLKGRFDNCKTILDAGCGSGRNIQYFLQNDYNVFGVDENPDAISEVLQLAKQLSPRTSPNNFIVSSVEDLPFEDAQFDLVISSAVLHFANNENHFKFMLGSIWRVLRPGGYLFCRLASNIGIEKLVEGMGNGRFLLPDGSERFLVNQQMLVNYTNKLRGSLFEPLKTTNVQNMRCMTTWCLQKNIT